MIKKFDYDVIVIGGGHAGVEASCASARYQVKTLLITKTSENLGEMSCNPAIGGVAKGTIVREIDALDGIMAKAIDMAGIHFRILNSSKGPAVHSPRAQADRKLYKLAISQIIKDYDNLDVLFESVENLIIKNNKIIGVETSNNCSHYCKSVVLTTGTFLRGVIHIGEKKISAGRINEKPSFGISKTLENYNFSLARLKTGTPPRINKNSINFTDLEKQYSDNPPQPFSYLNSKIDTEQTICYITYTNKKTHQIIKDNLQKSAMYGGYISGTGPRYCPSIEDKIHRFYEKERHQIFLEPEGLDSDLIYPNGISTSLPIEIQTEFLKTINGLENSVITQAGYAIEYDFVDPRELLPTLQTKKINGLFLAGQINGTTGYEEAGGQGIVAGINAAHFCNQSYQEFILDRSTSYIGVMIDDLTTLGTNEPYRMLTSRAEYRLNLRADNADFRLTEMGIKFNIISNLRKKTFITKKQKINSAIELLQQLKISPKKLTEHNISINQDGVIRNAYQLLSFQNINFEDIEKIWHKEISLIENDIKKQIKINATYVSYLKRQEDDIKIFKEEENMKIPLNINYNLIKTLSNEVREKLNKYRPVNISAASKIQGITPASIIAIIIFIKKQKKKNEKKS